MRSYKTAFYGPALSDSENFESWEENGSNDMRARACNRWKTLLDQYEQPPINKATDEALRAFIAKRKSELQMLGTEAKQPKEETYATDPKRR